MSKRDMWAIILGFNACIAVLDAGERQWGHVAVDIFACAICYANMRGKR